MVQSRKLWPRLDRFVIFFFSSKFINDFLVINSLLLKIKYKLYVSILFTSIPFVFAFIFKFIVRGPNPGNSPLYNNMWCHLQVVYCPPPSKRNGFTNVFFDQWYHNIHKLAHFCLSCILMISLIMLIHVKNQSILCS